MQRPTPSEPMSMDTYGSAVLRASGAPVGLITLIRHDLRSTPCSDQQTAESMARILMDAIPARSGEWIAIYCNEHGISRRLALYTAHDSKWQPWSGVQASRQSA
jgi:hypothetical protein